MIHDAETSPKEQHVRSPGDVSVMGTDGSPRNMKPGDVCEVEIMAWHAAQQGDEG
jgi:hypothetical protein